MQRVFCKLHDTEPHRRVDFCRLPWEQSPTRTTAASDIEGEPSLVPLKMQEYLLKFLVPGSQGYSVGWVRVNLRAKCTRCDKKIRWMFKLKKIYITVKDTLPLIPLKVHPSPRFEHTYPIALATFWSSSGSPLSWVSLVALSWLPRCPESIQNFYLSWSFWLWWRARSHMVPDPVNKVEEDTP